MQVLTQQTIPGYLAAKGVLEKGEPLEIIPIPSNVNHVYRVATPKRTLIVKQAMSKMALFPQIHLPLERSAIEYQATAIWKRIGQEHQAPVLLPEIIHFDKTNNAFILVAAPDDARLLTADLLAANIRSSVIQHMLKLFVIVHNKTFQDKALKEKFANTSNFTQLKFGFFHKPMLEREKNARVKHALYDLMVRTLKNKVCLLHGDPNPKNILVARESITLIDFECSHYGDPAYDISTLLAHYLLSALINFDQRQKYFEAMREGFERYCSRTILPYRAQLRRNIIQHFGPLLWGRAFGKANVPFLDERLKQCVRILSRRIVVGNYTELEDIFTMVNGYRKELKNLPKVDVASAMKQVLF